MKINHNCLNNLDKWDCILGKGTNDSMVGLIKDSSIYCKVDCKVLMEGYGVFRSWISEWISLDVDNYIIIQSLASGYMLRNG